MVTRRSARLLEESPPATSLFMISNSTVPRRPTCMCSIMCLYVLQLTTWSSTHATYNLTFIHTCAHFRVVDFVWTSLSGDLNNEVHHPCGIHTSVSQRPAVNVTWNRSFFFVYNGVGFEGEFKNNNKKRLLTWTLNHNNKQTPVTKNTRIVI